MEVWILLVGRLSPEMLGFETPQPVKEQPSSELFSLLLVLHSAPSS